MSSPKKPDDQNNPAGRVKHDAGGRAIWEWAVDTGRHALDSTSRLLKRLDLPGLSILDEELEKKKKAEEEERIAREAGSNPYGENAPTFGGKPEVDPLAGGRRDFNPYDNRAPPKRGAPTPPVKTAPRIAQSPKPKKPGLLGKLFGR